MFSITVGSCRVFSLTKILIMAAINAVAITEKGTDRGIAEGLTTESITNASTVVEAFTSQIRQQA